MFFTGLRIAGPVSSKERTPFAAAFFAVACLTLFCFFGFSMALAMFSVTQRSSSSYPSNSSSSSYFLAAFFETCFEAFCAFFSCFSSFFLAFNASSSSSRSIPYSSYRSSNSRSLCLSLTAVTISTRTSSKINAIAIITTISRKFSTKLRIFPHIPFPLLNLLSEEELPVDSGVYF